MPGLLAEIDWGDISAWHRAQCRDSGRNAWSATGVMLFYGAFFTQTPIILCRVDLKFSVLFLQNCFLCVRLKSVEKGRCAKKVDQKEREEDEAGSCESPWPAG